MSRLYVICEVTDPQTKKPIKLISSIHPDNVSGSKMAVNRTMRMTRFGMPKNTLSISVTRHRPTIGGI